MEDERKVAKGDAVLKEVVSRWELGGEVYSSEDELDLDLPYLEDESTVLEDDIEEQLYRNQIRQAKNFYHRLIEDGTNEEEDDQLHRLLADTLPPPVLRPSADPSQLLSYLESAIVSNSKMRDSLLVLKQTLLTKKRLLEDRICDLEENQDDPPSPPPVEKTDSVVSWGPLEYQPSCQTVVFFDGVVAFLNRFSQPYFKDKQNFWSPPCLDSLERKKMCEVFVSLIEPSRHWHPRCIDTLEIAIKKSLVDEFKNRPDFNAIIRWREYSSFVKSHSLKEILKDKPESFKIDWLNVATLLPDEESRSSSECSKLWDMYLSPKYDKDPWSEAEDERIIELSKKFEEQDWEKVAEELGTARSSFQIFSYFQSNLRNRVHVGEKWTVQEDDFLRKVVSSCTYGNFISWKKVRYYFDKRSPVQVYNRWKNALMSVKKGKFSEKEDRALMTALAHGMSFDDTAKALKGQRSAQQIRERVMAIIKFGRDDSLNVGDWSLEEDKKLLELVRTRGEKWPEIAKEMEIRDRTQCRHRYNRLKKHISENPNFSIEDINRQRRKGYNATIKGRRSELLRVMRKGSMSQRRKKEFLKEVDKIMRDTDNKSQSTELSLITPGALDKYDKVMKYLGARGSGCWAPFDFCKSSTQEKNAIVDCCRVLGARLNYNCIDSVSCDEHCKPVVDVIKSLKEESVCDASLAPELLVSENTASLDLCLLPPNRSTCNAFLQSLSFCSLKEKNCYKRKEDNPRTNNEITRAQQLFQQRLLQLFLWPALLTNKNKKDKLDSFTNAAS